MSKKRTARIKSKVSRKTGKPYYYLRMRQEVSNGNVVVVDIPCDANGKVKTYQKDRKKGMEFIYLNIGEYEQDNSYQNRGSSNLLPQSRR